MQQTLLVLIAGILGAVTSQWLFTPDTVITPERPSAIALTNPFQADAPITDNSADIMMRLDDMQYQLNMLQERIDNFEQQTESAADVDSAEITSAPPRFRAVTPTQQLLVESGIAPDTADDLLRKISAQNFRRLELQNLISRSQGPERQTYQEQLRQLNRNRLSLRTEMGDEVYNRYLYASGQNNRMQVRTVMSASPAETAGFETGDIILRYDNQQVLNWQDIRKATMQGEIGSFTQVEILRNNTPMTLTVARGTLGVELDGVRLEPTQ